MIFELRSLCSFDDDSDDDLDDHIFFAMLKREY